MHTQMRTNRRRVIIAAGIACIVCIAQQVQGADRTRVTPQPGKYAESDRELVDRAMAFLSRRYAHREQVFAFPVSRLQREFLLGYRRACSLAEELQAAGCWSLRARTDGSRYARILR